MLASAGRRGKAASKGTIALYGLAVAILVWTLAGPGATAGIYTRQDADDGNYFVGRFTWREGQGGVAWGPAESDDIGGAGKVDWENFTSPPIPRKVHLNASRLIEIDLYTSGYASEPQYGTSCRTLLRATLFMDEQPIGFSRGDIFAIAGQNTGRGRPNTTFPLDPAGFGVCRLRLQSEVSILPEGATLRVQVQHWFGDDIRFGMGSGHRSVIRFPEFSPDEMPYRFPSFAHGPLTNPGGPAGVGRELLVGAGIGALCIPVLRRRVGRRAILVVFLLSSLTMAGCADRSGSETGDGPRTGIHVSPVSAAYQEGKTREGTGWLIGQVAAAELDAPIQGAHVALIGTDNSTRTDPYGRFVFRDLRAGEYRLRIDHEAYRPFEAAVAVISGLIAQVNVTLSPSEAVATDARPHIHDYWGADDEITLMDNVSLGTREGCYQGPVCGPFTVDAFVIPRAVDAYASVLPGTYEVNVTVWWDRTRMNLDAQGLELQTNNDRSLDNSTRFALRGPGVPFVIPTAWEMSDPGHQKFSSWVFALNGGVSYLRTPERTVHDTGLNVVDPPTYFVTLKIRKGTVPLEPAHQDLWNGRDAVKVVDALTRRKTGDLDWQLAWLPAQLIPPEAVRLEVYANASRESFIDHPLELRVKTARSGVPNALCWKYSGNNAEYCNGPDYALQPSPTISGRSRLWRMDVAADDADPFYAVRSFWAFHLRPKEEPQSPAMVGADRFASSTSLDITFTVIAYRGAES